MHAKWLSCDWLFATAYTAAQQAPLCMGFCRQEYWSGLPFPLPGDLPNPVIKPASLNVYLHWQAGYLPVAHVHEYIHTVPKACKYYVSISYSSRCSWGPAQCTQTFGVLQFSCSVMSDSLWPRGLYSPWNFPGHNVGVGSLSLLHRIFPTQGLNPGLPHCRQILYQLSHKGSPKIQEWVTYPFSSRSSCPRKRTRVETLVLWF